MLEKKDVPTSYEIAREWIGAQMRGAVCGYLARGNPYVAAKLAWIDGEISHHNNGIIGEVFNAILTSLAFVRNGAREVLEETISMQEVVDMTVKCAQITKENL